MQDGEAYERDFRLKTRETFQSVPGQEGTCSSNEDDLHNTYYMNDIIALLT